MKKKRSVILEILIAGSLLLAVGCDDGGSTDDGVTYAYVIGDTGPAGGLIFYVDKADNYDWTYLEVAPSTTEWTAKVWGGYTTTVIGADGTGIGTGKQNTIDIVNQFGAQEPYANKTDYAAKLCSDLISGGYEDWFLPSKDELNAIWENLVDDGDGLNSDVGGFANTTYWSSSEHSTSYAWIQDFYGGMQMNYLYRDSDRRVRAIRAF